MRHFRDVWYSKLFDRTVMDDWLARGAFLDLTINADGVVEGQLFIPDGQANGTPLNADMFGSWSLKGSTVRFSQAADTFVRDMGFRRNDVCDQRRRRRRRLRGVALL